MPESQNFGTSLEGEMPVPSAVREDPSQRSLETRREKLPQLEALIRGIERLGDWGAAVPLVQLAKDRTLPNRVLGSVTTDALALIAAALGMGGSSDEVLSMLGWDPGFAHAMTRHYGDKPLTRWEFHVRLCNERAMLLDPPIGSRAT